MKTRHSIPGLLALAASMVVASFGEAVADCGTSDRVRHGDSECLTAWWDNNSWPSKTDLNARNECPDWGKVVVKWDLKNASDRTWHLNNGNVRRAQSSANVRWAYCCSDISDLCNKSDVLTVANCRARFENSSVHSVNDCWLQSSGGAVSVTGENCEFWAICRRDNGSEAAQYITVPWPDANDLVNCDGDLRQGSC